MLASLVVEVAGAPLVTGTVVVLVWMVTVVGTVMVRLGMGMKTWGPSTSMHSKLRVTDHRDRETEATVVDAMFHIKRPLFL
jgi:hypothetical protein